MSCITVPCTGLTIETREEAFGVLRSTDDGDDVDVDADVLA